MKKNLLLPALCALILPLTGCSSKNNDPRLLLAPSVQNNIRVLTLEQGTSASGGARMMAEVENRKKRSKQKLEYRVEWFEENGFPVETVSSRWNFFSLLPESKHTITTVSPRPEASQFRLHIKEAD